MRPPAVAACGSQPPTLFVAGGWYEGMVVCGRRERSPAACSVIATAVGAAPRHGRRRCWSCWCRPATSPPSSTAAAPRWSRTDGLARCCVRQAATPPRRPACPAGSSEAARARMAALRHGRRGSLQRAASSAEWLMLREPADAPRLVAGDAALRRVSATPSSGTPTRCRRASCPRPGAGSGANPGSSSRACRGTGPDPGRPR